jgi:hypothetical protein
VDAFMAAPARGHPGVVALNVCKSARQAHANASPEQHDNSAMDTAPPSGTATSTNSGHSACT